MASAFGQKVVDAIASRGALGQGMRATTTDRRGGRAFVVCSIGIARSARVALQFRKFHRRP